MAEQVRYSDHLDTLLALVTHLAMTKWRSRRPSSLAKWLSLDEEEIRFVLENFKGLFRRSIRTSKETGECFYTLQLRYARRWLYEDREKRAKLPDDIDLDNEGKEDEDAEALPPLDAAHLSALLSFISDMVEQEQTSARQNRANWITFTPALIAAIAATAAAVISYLR